MEDSVAYGGDSDLCANRRLEGQSTATLKRVSAILNNEKQISLISDASFEYLGELVVENTALTRRNLKSIFESEALSIHSRFIEKYQREVVNYLESKLSEVDSLQDFSTECIGKLSSNQDRLSSTISRCEESEGEIRQLESKLEVLKKCRLMFVVEPELHLRVSECLLDDTLLDLFDLVNTKRQNSLKLIELATNNLAVDSLSKSMDTMDVLLEKIGAGISKGTILQVARALGCFAERPHMRERCLGDLSKQRLERLNESFVNVLMSGLELNALDGPRFLGDMLHWFWEQMLLDNEWASVAGLKPLDGVFSGVEEMISERISGILRSTYSLQDAHKLVSVVRFYHSKLLMTSATGWLGTVLEKVSAHFSKLWRNRIENANDVVPSSLHAFPFLNESTYVLSTILENDQDQSIIDIDLLVNLCERIGSESLKDGEINSAQLSVFLVNCFSAITKVLTSDIALQDRQTSQFEKLMSETTEMILKKVGLLETAALSFNGFYTALFTQGIWAIGPLDQLATGELREAARRAVGNNVATVYEKLYNEYPQAAGHTPDQIRVLLDV